jgi:hypothetical protein
VIRESFQLNVDLNAEKEQLNLFVKDQSLIASSVLARLQISTKELLDLQMVSAGNLNPLILKLMDRVRNDETLKPSTAVNY